MLKLATAGLGLLMRS